MGAERASKEKLVCSPGRAQKKTTVPTSSGQTHLLQKAKVGGGG